MNNLLKSLIVWLMLVAIPFQGFAAAGTLTCAPQAAVSAMTPEHCAMMAADGHHQQADAAVTDHPAPHQHTGGKCSTCASCCFGAVMAPPVPVLPVPGETPALAAAHFTDRHVARVDLALPERPPRFTLN